MSTDKAFFKPGRGSFGKGQTPVTKDNILLFRPVRTTSELINNGPDGKNPYITALALVDPTGTGIISGGKISWITGYKYNVPAYTYAIRGKVYSTDAVRPELDQASDTVGENREDTFVGTFDSEGNGLIKILKGSYALNPVAPTITYETQVFLSTVRINAQTSQPAGVDNMVIYDAHTEFATTSSMSLGTVDFDSIVGPFSEAKCISVVDFISGDELVFSGDSFFPYDNTVLQLQIEPTSGLWAQNGILKVGFFLDALRVSDWIFIESNKTGEYSFDSGLAEWQNISINITDFNFTQNSANKLKIIKDDDKGPDSFKLDLLRMQKGMVSGKTSVKTKLSEFVNDVPFLVQTDLTIPTLQQVIQAGSYVELDSGGNCTGEIMGGTANDRITWFDHASGTQSAGFSNSVREFSAGHFVNNVGSARLRLINGEVLLSRSNLSAIPTKTSTIKIDHPTNNTNFRFPAKAADGDYIVATLDDITGDWVDRSTNQEVWGNKTFASTTRFGALSSSYFMQATGTLLFWARPGSGGCSLTYTDNQASRSDLILPHDSGYLVSTVNNISADSNGNVTIATGGGVATVTGTAVNNTDPLNPIINIPADTGEPALGNPAANGYVLSSTTGGIRSWIAPATGGADTSTKIHDQTVAATVWIFAHGLSQLYPAVTVYTATNEVIQPEKIQAIDANTLEITFSAAAVGKASATAATSMLVGVPATAISTGAAGQIAYDASYIYMCIAANTWKRSPLTTW